MELLRLPLLRPPLNSLLLEVLGLEERTRPQRVERHHHRPEGEDTRPSTRPSNSHAKRSKGQPEADLLSYRSLSCTMHNLQVVCSTSFPFNSCFSSRLPVPWWSRLDPPAPLHHAVDIQNLSNGPLSTHEISYIQRLVVALQDLQRDIVRSAKWKCSDSGHREEGVV